MYSLISDNFLLLVFSHLKMNEILQLCETQNSNYPHHFQIFLDNCLHNYGDTFLSNDYLFAAIYFIVLESGFCPLNLYDEFPHLCTDSFDIRKLRCIKSYSKDCLKLVELETVKYWVYVIPLKLGKYRSQCELQCVRAAENGSYVIINLIHRAISTVKTVCLCAENYVDKEEKPSKHLFRLKNLNELTLLIRNKICNSVKELIMVESDTGCCPNILRLPEDLQQKIIYFLIGNAVDVQNLALTCTYFYNIITNDLKLWELLSMSEFDGRTLNQALEEILQRPVDNLNIFRNLFLKLKTKQLNRPYIRRGNARREAFIDLL